MLFLSFHHLIPRNACWLKWELGAWEWADEESVPFPDGLNDYLCKLLWSEEDGEKQSEISTHSSIAVFTSFVGVSPAAGAE